MQGVSSDISIGMPAPSNADDQASSSHPGNKRSLRANTPSHTMERVQTNRGSASVSRHVSTAPLNRQHSGDKSRGPSKATSKATSRGGTPNAVPIQPTTQGLDVVETLRRLGRYSEHA